MKKSAELKSRRMFIGKLAVGTAVGLTSLTALKRPENLMNGADAWFKTAKGAHRIVYDASEPHDGLPFIWSWVFYHSNNETGVPDSDMTSMIVLRHNAIPFALEDRLWQKYKLGEVFKVTDNTTGKPALRNPFYEPREGDFLERGIDGIHRMQERGGMFCVCNMALKFYSEMVAKAASLEAEQVYEDWKSGVLPDIQIVPSGVWAVGRAQEHGFAYCYAGG